MDNAFHGIPLNALRCFEAAARRLSFAEAATELGVTPAAVSIQVRRLEARIGRPLFVRGHRSVRLTPLGERLAAPLGAVFGDLARVVEEVLAPAADLLVVSAMPSFAVKWLAPRMADFARRHPGISVRVEGADALADLARGDADIGLRYGPGDYPGLSCVRLAPARAFPVCSPAYREAHADRLRTPSGLAGLPLLEDETALRAPGLPDWAAWFAAAGAERGRERRGAVFESLHLALTAAAAGQGVALGMSPLVDDDLASGALVRLFETEVESPYGFWIVCRPDRLRSRKVRAFHDWVIETMRQGAPPAAG